jgi:hypothetical protein
MYTYDLATDIGRVRRTIPDRTEQDAIWSDEEIASFISDEGGSWRLATALALETIASDNLLVLKVLRVQNIETNTDKMAQALMQRATKLREIDTAFDSDDGGDFDFAEVVETEFQLRERLYNQALRSA